MNDLISAKTLGILSGFDNFLETTFATFQGFIRQIYVDTKFEHI